MKETAKKQIRALKEFEQKAVPVINQIIHAFAQKLLAMNYDRFSLAGIHFSDDGYFRHEPDILRFLAKFTKAGLKKIGRDVEDNREYAIQFEKSLREVIHYNSAVLREMFKDMFDAKRADYPLSIPGILKAIAQTHGNDLSAMPAIDRNFIQAVEQLKELKDEWFYNYDAPYSCWDVLKAACDYIHSEHYKVHRENIRQERKTSSLEYIIELTQPFISQVNDMAACDNDNAAMQTKWANQIQASDALKKPFKRPHNLDRTA